MKKTCSKCRINKDLTEFYDKGKENRKASYCKSCFNIYCMDRWKQRKLESIEFKGGCCIKCGYNKCPHALEFHHRDPAVKEYTWNKMRYCNIKTLQKELNKCDLLCSNCHRELHWELGV